MPFTFGAQSIRAAHVALLSCVLFVLFFAQACATHAEIRHKMVEDVRMGNYSGAYSQWEKVSADSSSKDYIMDQMDLALILHRQGRYADSNLAIERIKDKLDDLYGVQWGDELAAIAWNDAQRAFEGEEFERVYIHLLSAFNYLHLNKLEDAGVEARQLNHRLQVYVDKLKENKVTTSYVQDPFGQFLAGLIQESFGEDNEAFRSYEDAWMGYQRVGALMDVDSPPPLRTGLIRTARRLGWDEKIEQFTNLFGDSPEAGSDYWADKGRLVVISGVGLVAHKEQRKWIIPDPEFDTIVVTYPVFAESSFAGRYVDVMVEGQRKRAERSHDLSTLAIKMLNEKNDQVKGRAIAKAILRYAAKKATKHIAKRTKSDTGKAIAMIANIALNVYDMVEAADTRSWMTLPDHIRIAELPVSPGTHDVVVRHGGMGMLDEQRFILPFRAGETRFLITRGREPGMGQPSPPARPVDTIAPGSRPQSERPAVAWRTMPGFELLP